MSDYDSNALSALDEWFGQVLEGLSPAKRKRAAMKLGLALRRSNLDRMSRNVEPDGAPMEKRKPRLDQRGRLRRKAGGKMFRKLRLAREWSIKATAESVEIAPTKNDKIASTHHFGLRSFVGRSPDGRKIFTRYPERRLLGFDDSDQDAVLDVIAQLFEG